MSGSRAEQCVNDPATCLLYLALAQGTGTLRITDEDRVVQIVVLVPLRHAISATEAQKGQALHVLQEGA